MTTISRLFFGIASALSLVLLGACAGDDGDGLPYNREQMRATMNTLDETAYVIWGNSGSEWDQQGERELYPTTDEGWQELVEASRELVTMGEDLADDVDSDDPRAEAWKAYAAGISEVSQKLIVATETQDKQAVFDEGGVLYQVCKACHGTFPAPEEVAGEDQ